MNTHKFIQYILTAVVAVVVVLLFQAGLKYAAAVTSGLDPAPIEYLDNVYVNSVEFKRAIVGDFCEVNIETNICSQNSKSITLGEAVLKYKPGFSKDPDQPPISHPFGLFILDDEIYVTFVPSGTILPGIFTRPQLYPEPLDPDIVDPEFDPANPVNPKSRGIHSGSRLLPAGLDHHRYFIYRIVTSNDEWKEIFLNLYTFDVRKETGFIPTPKIGEDESKFVDAFFVDSKTLYKKLKLVRINKVLNDFVIDLK